MTLSARNRGSRSSFAWRQSYVIAVTSTQRCTDTLDVRWERYRYSYAYELTAWQWKSTNPVVIRLPLYQITGVRWCSCWRRLHHGHFRHFHNGTTENAGVEIWHDTARVENTGVGSITWIQSKLTYLACSCQIIFSTLLQSTSVQKYRRTGKNYLNS